MWANIYRWGPTLQHKIYAKEMMFVIRLNVIRVTCRFLSVSHEASGIKASIIPPGIISMELKRVYYWSKVREKQRKRAANLLFLSELKNERADLERLTTDAVTPDNFVRYMIKSKLVWDRVRVWSVMCCATKVEKERPATLRKRKNERGVGRKSVIDQPNG